MEKKSPNSRHKRMTNRKTINYWEKREAEVFMNNNKVSVKRSQGETKNKYSSIIKYYCIKSTSSPKNINFAYLFLLLSNAKM